MYKQAIIIRKDIKMGKGKLAAHAAHASLLSMKKANRDIVEKWEKEGAKKVVLKVSSLEEMIKIYKKLKGEKIPCALVSDAGLTQLEKGTITAVGAGPAEEKIIDKVTGKLKLL